MKRKTIILILVTMVLLLTACDSTKEYTPEERDNTISTLENGVYTNTELGMTVTLPDGWVDASGTSGEFYFASDDTYDTYISLDRWGSKDSIREEDSAQKYIENLVDNGYEAISNIVVGNTEFYAAEYSGTYVYTESNALGMGSSDDENGKEGVYCEIIAQVDVDDYYYELEIVCQLKDYSSEEEALAEAQATVEKALESIKAAE